MNWQPVPKRCGHLNDGGKYRGEGGKNTFPIVTLLIFGYLCKAKMRFFP